MRQTLFIERHQTPLEAKTPYRLLRLLRRGGGAADARELDQAGPRRLRQQLQLNELGLFPLLLPLLLLLKGNAVRDHQLVHAAGQACRSAEVDAISRPPADLLLLPLLLRERRGQVHCRQHGWFPAARASSSELLEVAVMLRRLELVRRRLTLGLHLLS